MNDSFFKKQKLRKALTQERELIKKHILLEFNEISFNKLIKNINFNDIKYIASFISIRSEISTKKLNKKIIDLKKILSLPIIEKNSQELKFKKFNLN